jgi:hypothetical protein
VDLLALHQDLKPDDRLLRHLDDRAVRLPGIGDIEQVVLPEEPLANEVLDTIVGAGLLVGDHGQPDTALRFELGLQQRAGREERGDDRLAVVLGPPTI